MRGGSKISIIGLALSAAIALLVACGSSGNDAASAEMTPVRNCVDRAESPVIRPNPRTDSLVPGLAFYVARTNFDSAVQDLRSQQKLKRDRWISIKILSLVTASDDVVVEVAPDQRGWLALKYVPNKPRTSSVAFAPCAQSSNPKEQKAECQTSPFRACRSGVTAFNGAIEVNFGKAKRVGRCAKFLVSVGEMGSRTLYPFAKSKQCS